MTCQPKIPGCCKRCSPRQAKFNGNGVTFDTSVHNPARIWKFYGTLACKGDSLPDRPHRLARILEVPDKLEIVPRELLESVAQSEIVNDDQRAQRTASNDPDHAFLAAWLPKASGKSNVPEGFDVRAYLETHGLTIRKTKPYGDGTLYELQVCPWRPDQKQDVGKTYVIQFADGYVMTACQHGKCRQRQGLG